MAGYNAYGTPAYSGYTVPVPQNNTTPTFTGGYVNSRPQTPLPAGYQSQQVVWVKGVEGLNSYYLSPGSSAMLMDSDNPYLYVKSVDLSGKANVTAYHLVETDLDKIANSSKNDYLTNLSDVIATAIDKKFEEYGIYKRANHKKEEAK